MRGNGDSFSAQMFSTVIIQAKPERSPLLRALAADTCQLALMREFSGVPTPYELMRILNTIGPDVVLIDLEGGLPALECGARIVEQAPRTSVIGFGGSPEVMIRANQVGFTALLDEKSDTDDFRIAIRESLRARQGGMEEFLFSFLPCKAGSGATTVVLNTAVALSQNHNKRILVIDADLRSSVLAILLDAHTQASTQNVLAKSGELDQFIWSSSVVQAFGVDFLLSSRSLDAGSPEWADYFQLLNYVRRRYDAILVDLPELVNPATIELVRRSRKVFLVATTEVPSLKLAQQRRLELDRWKVDMGNVGVVLNRLQKNDLAPAEIARILSLPVLKALPNDYPTVSAAQIAGQSVPQDTRLGKAYAEFAAYLAQENISEKAPTLGQKLMSLFAS